MGRIWFPAIQLSTSWDSALYVCTGSGESSSHSPHFRDAQAGMGLRGLGCGLVVVGKECATTASLNRGGPELCPLLSGNGLCGLHALAKDQSREVCSWAEMLAMAKGKRSSI